MLANPLICPLRKARTCRRTSAEGVLRGGGAGGGGTSLPAGQDNEDGPPADTPLARSASTPQTYVRNLSLGLKAELWFGGWTRRPWIAFGFGCFDLYIETADSVVNHKALIMAGSSACHCFTSVHRHLRKKTHQFVWNRNSFCTKFFFFQFFFFRLSNKWHSDIQVQTHQQYKWGKGLFSKVVNKRNISHYHESVHDNLCKCIIQNSKNMCKYSSTEITVNFSTTYCQSFTPLCHSKLKHYRRAIPNSASLQQSLPSLQAMDYSHVLKPLVNMSQ